MSKSRELPKYLKTTESGFRVVGNTGNRNLSTTFKVDKESGKLIHKWADTVYHVGNRWSNLSDSQKYRRVCEHWATALDLKQTNAQRKANYEKYWAYIDQQIGALNAVVDAWNATATEETQKRSFSRTEALCKKLYPMFIKGQSINIKNLIVELAKAEAA